MILRLHAMKDMALRVVDVPRERMRRKTNPSPKLQPFYVGLNILVDIIPAGMLPLAASLASSGLSTILGTIILVVTAVNKHMLSGFFLLSVSLMHGLYLLFFLRKYRPFRGGRFVFLERCSIITSALIPPATLTIMLARAL